MAKKTTSLQSSRLLGITFYQPQAQKVLPEPKVEKVIKIRGPGIQMEVRNPKKVSELLKRYPGSKVVE